MALSVVIGMGIGTTSTGGSDDAVADDRLDRLGSPPGAQLYRAAVRSGKGLERDEEQRRKPVGRDAPDRLSLRSLTNRILLSAG